jgi:hypothetical protein
MSLFTPLTPSNNQLPHLVTVDDLFRAIALMMEAASTSETSVNFYQTAQKTVIFLGFIC